MRLGLGTPLYTHRLVLVLCRAVEDGLTQLQVAQAWLSLFNKALHHRLRLQGLCVSSKSIFVWGSATLQFQEFLSWFNRWQGGKVGALIRFTRALQAAAYEAQGASARVWAVEGGKV